MPDSQSPMTGVSLAMTDGGSPSTEVHPSMTDWHSAMTEQDSRATGMPSRVNGRVLINDSISLAGEWRAVINAWSAPGRGGNSLSDGQSAVFGDWNFHGLPTDDPDNRPDGAGSR